jgi:hypothetical protein
MPTSRAEEAVEHDLDSFRLTDHAQILGCGAVDRAARRTTSVEP